MILWSRTSRPVDCVLMRADDTGINTNEAQPPVQLHSSKGLAMKVLEGDVGKKWFGYMLSAQRSRGQDLDVPSYQPQEGSTMFHANTCSCWIETEAFATASAILIFLSLYCLLAGWHCSVSRQGACAQRSPARRRAGQSQSQSHLLQNQFAVIEVLRPGCHAKSSLSTCVPVVV